MTGVYVDSFTKQSATGNQDITLPADVVTAMNAGPYAVIFWTAGSEAASGTWTGDVLASLGYVGSTGGTGGITQYGVGAWVTNGVATAESARRMAAAAITLPDNTGASTYWQASFVGTQGTTAMRINWTTMNGGTFNVTVNYMIVTGLTNAKVVNWTTPSGASDKAVTGVGFSPDLVLHAAGRTNSMPESLAYALLTFGMMNRHGQQGANAFISADNVSPSDANRFQQTDAAWVSVGTGAGSNGEAHFKSMDADGFTLNFSTAVGAVQHCFSLCMEGVSSKIGAFTKTSSATDPTVQSVTTSHGFAVRGALFSGQSQSPQASPTSQAKWNLGATDGTNQRTAYLRDVDNVSPANAQSIWRNDAVWIEDDGNPSPTTYQVGAWSSADTSSFTISWNPSDTWSPEVLYLLLGDYMASTPERGPVTRGEARDRGAAGRYVSSQVA